MWARFCLTQESGVTGVWMMWGFIEHVLQDAGTRCSKLSHTVYFKLVCVNGGERIESPERVRPFFRDGEGKGTLNRTNSSAVWFVDCHPMKSLSACAVFLFILFFPSLFSNFTQSREFLQDCLAMCRPPPTFKNCLNNENSCSCILWFGFVTCLAKAVSLQGRTL